MKHKILIVLILVFACIIRFYKLGEIPAGIHEDEVSHGYNAFSLLQTGKDRYAQAFPILFRSFGSYQPPLYTYLATIPVKLSGNTIFSIRTVSATAGIFLVLIAYLISLQIFDGKKKYFLGLSFSFMVAISPWAINYNRLTAEGSLGVTVFTLSILFFILSLKNIKYFPVACFILGLSTHAYYSERVIAILLLPLLLFFYRKEYLKLSKKWIIAGLIVFAVTLIPHLLIAETGALTRRLAQVGYLGSKSPVIEFIRQYLIYFSPSNLFFDTGVGLSRISPGMGVFYTIFIIPFLFGIRYFTRFVKQEYFRLFAILIVISPIPAAMTGDNFYPLRTLDLIWIFTLIISIGFFAIANLIKNKGLSFLVLAGAISWCLFTFYVSYFVLFKYEMAKDYGDDYISLTKVLETYKDKKIIIDSSRDPGVGLRIAYLEKYNPVDLQKQLKSQLTTPYYSADVNNQEKYVLGNITTDLFNWKDACDPNTIIVGDILTISSEQAKNHNLKLEFEIKDLNGTVTLMGYSTNPTKETCP